MGRPLSPVAFQLESPLCPGLSLSSPTACEYPGLSTSVRGPLSFIYTFLPSFFSELPGASQAAALAPMTYRGSGKDSPSSLYKWRLGRRHSWRPKLEVCGFTWRPSWRVVCVSTYRLGCRGLVCQPFPVLEPVLTGLGPHSNSVGYSRWNALWADDWYLLSLRKALCCYMPPES